jgi:hypothetical protein
MLCIRCGILNPEQAKFCNGCGQPFLLNATPEAPEPTAVLRTFSTATTGRAPIAEEKSGGPGRVLGVLAVVAILIVIAMVTVSKNEYTELPLTRHTYQIKDKDNGSHVIVFLSEDAVNRVMDAASSNDRYGFDEAIQSQSITVENGTRVLILDFGVLRECVKVRILSGPLYGRVVYLPRKFALYKEVVP